MGNMHGCAVLRAIATRMALIGLVGSALGEYPSARHRIGAPPNGFCRNGPNRGCLGRFQNSRCCTPERGRYQETVGC